ncbi:MAG: hypothetical protein LC744_07685, partial [Chloroflexi bacterium]|nr:hypothetical protein [Chloroflexota bacterium]
MRLAQALRPVVGRFLPRGAIILSVLVFGNYLLAYGRNLVFARTYGAGAELDAYNAAFVIPELTLGVLVASGLAAPFVPLFIGLKQEDARAAEAFGQTILTGAVLVMGSAALVLFLLAPQTAAVIAPGFGPERRGVYAQPIAERYGPDDDAELVERWRGTVEQEAALCDEHLAECEGDREEDGREQHQTEQVHVQRALLGA